MSTNELNTTAKELLSIRSMIAELEAEAEARATAGKLPGRTWFLAALIPRGSRPTMQTYTASTASRPPQPASVWEHEKGPHIPADQSKRI